MRHTACQHNAQFIIYYNEPPAIIPASELAQRASAFRSKAALCVAQNLCKRGRGVYSSRALAVFFTLALLLCKFAQAFMQCQIYFLIAESGWAQPFGKL